MSSLILDKEYTINDSIIVNIPTIGEVLDFGEALFWNAVSIMTLIPSDVKWLLWKNKIDYMKISDFELFRGMCGVLSDEQSSILFKNIKISDFYVMKNTKTDEIYLENKDGIIINEEVYTKLSDIFREFNGSKKKVEKAANKHTKMFLINESRLKAEKNKNKPFRSILEDMIISLVCSPEFPYDYDTVRDVGIVAFMKSVKQINKRIYALATIQGSMSGFVDSSKIKREAFEWMCSSGEVERKQQLNINL